MYYTFSMTSRRTKYVLERTALWGGIGVLVVLLGLLGNGTLGVYNKMKEAKQLRHAAEAEHEALVVRTAELEASLAQLATPRGVESVIRARYPLVKPGEQEYILVDQPTTDVDTASSTRESIWVSIFGWFSW